MMNRTLLFLAFVSGLASCGHKDPPPPPPPTSVNAYTVSSGSATFYISYPATITAVNQIDVRPLVSGYITGIYFTEGQKVQKGQKLYTIDQQQYRGAYEQAIAQLRIAEANLVKLQQDAERYQELGRQDAIAQQTVQHAMADLEAGKKQVEAAKANVNAIQVNLQYSTISAPLTGTIGISNVKIGASVTPGTTVLNTISSDNPIALDVPLDQSLVPFIERQKAQPESPKDSTFTLSFADQSRYPYPGKVFIIDRAVDPQTATIKVRFLFPNPKLELKAGMSANLQIMHKSAPNTIIIPYRATIEQMAEYFVFVINADTVAQRKVQLGARIRDQVVVSSGLKDNELIVLDGVQKLREGSKVKYSVVSPVDSVRKIAADTTKR